VATGRSRILVEVTQTRETTGGTSVSGPAWSPDGGWLAYVSDQLGTTDLWVVQYPENWTGG